MYFKQTDAILFAFSLGSYESFENINNWMKTVNEQVTTANYVKLVVGMKSDLDEIEVPYKEAAEYAKGNGAHYFETSSKTGSNVNEMF